MPLQFQKNNWFPAKDVKIVEEWSADSDKIVLGEPITWTITLIADGCLGSQIPSVPLEIPGHIKCYLDKPQIHNQQNSDSFSGVRQTKIALIAAEPGEFHLPEITIPWWDLQADQMRTAKLPARTLQVQPGPIAMNVPSTTPQISNSSPRENPIQEISFAKRTYPYWSWAVVGFSGICVIGLFIFFYHKIAEKIFQPDPKKILRKQLKSACRKNDPKEAEAVLLAWAALMYPRRRILNLAAMTPSLPPALQNAIHELYAALYGQKTSWQGALLWKAFRHLKLKKSSSKCSKSSASPLKELYPK